MADDIHFKNEVEELLILLNQALDLSHTCIVDQNGGIAMIKPDGSGSLMNGWPRAKVTLVEVDI